MITFTGVGSGSGEAETDDSGSERSVRACFSVPGGLHRGASACSRREAE